MVRVHDRAIHVAAAAALVLACLGLQPSAAQEGAPEVGVQQPEAAVQPADAAMRFRSFIETFRAEALAAGIPGDLYDRATSSIALNPRVEQLNLSQPEFVRPVWAYLDSAVTDARVSRGRDLIGVNTGLFTRLQAQYGVPEEVITAIWGMETGYGANLGSFNLFEALATLAYEGPRAAYGRRQLIAALKIAQTEGRDPSTMTSPGGNRTRPGARKSGCRKTSPTRPPIPRSACRFRIGWRRVCASSTASP
jgi:membrane-bound lytic murein transglycosylase B